ncbi:amidase signature enzyme [Hortaea werneckii]|nr:amidase signature enzyme [Hortaea werneckii]KAI7099403.1 amidase signature enzyme [Hortaea werneckii]KAI7244637.1 amidase signature enzyme [Hortaea werneckii]KAI7315569.1 amidase signature enzyme [Hortaea werneckii]KAI7377749.1 amidase signature enzyme [Hortaea werneckii]
MLSVASDHELQTLAPLDSDVIPMTVIRTNLSTFGIAEFNETISLFDDTDDVFTRDFLASVFLDYLGAGSFRPSIAQEMTAHPQNTSGSWPTLMTTEESVGLLSASLSCSLPNGPYFVSARTGAVFKAHRLYPDDYLTFIQGIISDEAGGYLSLPAVTENVMAKSVAVQSRLYSTISPEKPLAGLRLGVKDIYHVKGIKTSGGNRAYFYLYEAQNATAPAVQRLIDQGAILVGKMGTVQFANGDSPTADWVDLHCPFNPRADGYQDPSGSSTGPGAGIGAYDWLDIAVGSDTGGSMRGPAGAQGIYGNRPSTGAISMDHVIPLTPTLDTAGVFARSASLWSTVAHAWYLDFSDEYPAYPRQIYFSADNSGYGTSDSSGAMELVNGFVQELEDFLNANRTQVDVTQRWGSTHPSDSPSNITEMLHDTYGVLTSVDQYNLLGRPLFADYEAAHHGRSPYINPGPLVRWQWGIPRNESYDFAVHNMTVFRSWWETQGYGRNDTETCSKGIFVYPWSLGTPNYRDTYLDPPTQPPLGFSNWAIAGYAAGGEIVVPVGEVPYQSRITHQTEYLPVSVSLLVAHGCDLVLANLVRDLERNGILKASATGRRI